nr:probable protein phosphatase 2C 72 [Ipomoea trifida]
MGICISKASSEIHDADYGHENVVHFGDCNGVEVIGSAFSHPGSKGINQDAAILYQGYGVESGDFCGVFDGHGKNGHYVSKLVRNHLPSLLLNQAKFLPKISNKLGDDDDDTTQNKSFLKWKEGCVSAFKLMDKQIKQHEKLDCCTSGTTAVIAIRQDEDLVVANLGDSRAVLGRKTDNGVKAIQLTTDLKPSVPCEAERIRKCNGRVIALKEEPHIQRVWLPNEDTPGLAMSRAFGDFLLKYHGIISTPEVSYHNLSPNDHFLVLATDGVWDVLSNDEVISIVCSAYEYGEEMAAKAVVKAAVDAWKRRFPNSRRDDCTAICLYLQK